MQVAIRLTGSGLLLFLTVAVVVRWKEGGEGRSEGMKEGGLDAGRLDIDSEIWRIEGRV